MNCETERKVNNFYRNKSNKNFHISNTDMERIEEAARQWLEEHKKEYNSCDLERKDYDFIFTFSTDTDKSSGVTCSFSVTCPDSDDGLWSVWSEDSSLQPHLGVILEFCDSKRQKTIQEILDKINSVLPLVLDKSKPVTEDKEEMEEDDDYDVDDDDDDANFYDYNDDVEEESAVRNKTPEEVSSEEDDERFFGGKTNPTAFQRLVKDLKNMKKEAHKFGIEGTPRGDNLFIWDVKLTGFSADTTLGKDIKKWAENHKREPVVYLEMQFPGDYPMAPPFVRVTRPRFKFLTGHVTIGGSICMEMLTKSGWTPTNDIESILVQIRSEIMSDPNTRLDSNPDREYGEAEARDAFNRMVNRYGWNK
ncbi:ubiquitin-conjugating enzyme E2 Q2-like [Ruditapes philippinarum]|uniref:ubiquitin-conjugating enzyme E2 Q2-like n=1 Tax=Ruditapes philippinarum TaxID=129788 RepID=UPI00295BC05C|nr:ubiquitin-conjugating enzyme E2 Q2-like [Ruditapes philippinarum]